jgi:hypothetical protein
VDPDFDFLSLVRGSTGGPHLEGVFRETGSLIRVSNINTLLGPQKWLVQSVKVLSLAKKLLVRVSRTQLTVLHCTTLPCVAALIWIRLRNVG